MYCNRCGKYSGRYELCKECYYKQEDYDEIEENDEEEYEEYCNCIICEEEKDGTVLTL